MSSSKTIAKNTFFLYMRMFFSMGVSLYTSRVVLNTLGIQDYGVYSIVGGIVMMFSFFNSAMASATQRFLTFDIGKNDLVQLKKTFNATLNIFVRYNSSALRRINYSKRKDEHICIYEYCRSLFKINYCIYPCCF
jgi:hypothetical protein